MPSSTRLIPLDHRLGPVHGEHGPTVIATSLPAIAPDLGTDPIVLKLAFTTYLLSLTVFIPISGWLADRFGARHVFRVAIAVFTLGSIACGLADLAGRTGGGARPAGHRRRHDGAGRAHHPAPRRPQVRACRCAGLAHHPGSHRPAARAAGRRLHHRQLRLALDLLDERALRHRSPSCSPPCSCRRPESTTCRRSTSRASSCRGSACRR